MSDPLRPDFDTNYRMQLSGIVAPEEYQYTIARLNKVLDFFGSKPIRIIVMNGNFSKLQTKLNERSQQMQEALTDALADDNTSIPGYNARKVSLFITTEKTISTVHVSEQFGPTTTHMALPSLHISWASDFTPPPSYSSPDGLRLEYVDPPLPTSVLPSTPRTPRTPKTPNWRGSSPRLSPEGSPLLSSPIPLKSPNHLALSPLSLPRTPRSGARDFSELDDPPIISIPMDEGRRGCGKCVVS